VAARSLDTILRPNLLAPPAKHFATIDVGTMAEYEVYRGKLAAHPKHQENARKIEASGAIHSVYRAIIKKVERAQ
jgi:hypothetical protein